MPLGAVSSGQAKALLPFGIADNTTQQLIVRRGNSVSVPEPVIVATQQPAIFTSDSSGTGKGLIDYVNPDNGSLAPADESHPVAGGEVLVIRATGLGPVSSPPADGAVGSDAKSTVLAEVKVTVQGVPAEVLEAILAPGEVGVYAVKVRVPGGLVADASAVVRLTAGTQDSQPVTIAVLGDHASGARRNR